MHLHDLGDIYEQSIWCHLSSGTTEQDKEKTCSVNTLPPSKWHVARMEELPTHWPSENDAQMARLKPSSQHPIQESILLGKRIPAIEFFSKKCASRKWKLNGSRKYAWVHKCLRGIHYHNLWRISIWGLTPTAQKITKPITKDISLLFLQIHWRRKCDPGAKGEK